MQCLPEIIGFLMWAASAGIAAAITRRAFTALMIFAAAAAAATAAACITSHCTGACLTAPSTSSMVLLCAIPRLHCCMSVQEVDVECCGLPGDDGSQFWP